MFISEEWGSMAAELKGKLYEVKDPKDFIKEFTFFMRNEDFTKEIVTPDGSGEPSYAHYLSHEDGRPFEYSMWAKWTFKDDKKGRFPASYHIRVNLMFNGEVDRFLIGMTFKDTNVNKIPDFIVSRYVLNVIGREQFLLNDDEKDQLLLAILENPTIFDKMKSELDEAIEQDVKKEIRKRIVKLFQFG